MTYKRAADGVTKTGKTEGRNLGDSGPAVGIQKGGKGKGAKTVTGEQMRKFGRNLARAKNQGA